MGHRDSEGFRAGGFLDESSVKGTREGQEGADDWSLAVSRRDNNWVNPRVGSGQGTPGFLERPSAPLVPEPLRFRH